MAASEPDRLIRDRRDHGDEDDAREQPPPQRGRAEQREDDHGDEGDGEQERGSAARMRSLEASHGRDRWRTRIRSDQRLGGNRPVLEGVDRHVLGTVVLEDSLDLAGAPDQPDVADQECDADRSLDGDDGQTRRDVRLKPSGEQHGPAEEDADADRERDEDREPPGDTQRIRLALLVDLVGGDARGPGERTNAQREGLPEHEDAAQQRHAG